MYHYDLRVITYGLTSRVCEQLKQVPALAGFTLTYEETNVFTTSGWNRDTIFIAAGQLDAKQKQELCAAKETAHAYIILSVDVAQEDAAQSAFLQSVDEIWPVQLTPLVTQVLFNKSLWRIKEHCDYELAEGYLDTLIDNMPDMVWFKDQYGLHLKVNKKFCQVVGKDRADIQGKDHCYIWNIDHKEYEQGDYICMETEYPVLKQGKAMMFEETVKYGQRMHYLNTYKSPIYDHDGKIIGTVGFAKDITNIWSNRNEVKLVLNNIPSPTVLFDEEYKVFAVNSEFCKVFNVHEDNVIGRKGLEEVSVVVDNTHVEHRQEIDRETVKYDYVSVVNGISCTFRGMLHKLITSDGALTGAVLVLTDLTSEHERLLKLYNDSITDELTGVYNRTYYRAFLDKLVETKTKFTLAYLDLDHLKLANDKYGHKTGDEYILHVTELLKEAFFQHAAICRLGGDEFSILSESLTKEQVQDKLSLVDVLLKRMDLPYAPGISYGVDTVTVDNFEEFRQQANLIDQELYAMKQSKGAN